ncbi:MAG TPA: ATP-binding protein [Acidimicrobiales bacterium]|nr:ATP-binding protein [Acidimicrobiales bacterium]
MDPRPPVLLTAPAERTSVRLARILAAGVAADAGLSIDDTEDLRIAVSELVALLVDGVEVPGQSIVVRFSRAAGQVVVDGERPANGADVDGADAAVDDLALEILRVVVDDHSFDADAEGRRFHLVKRARVSP